MAVGTHRPNGLLLRLTSIGVPSNKTRTIKQSTSFLTLISGDCLKDLVKEGRHIPPAILFTEHLIPGGFLALLCSLPTDHLSCSYHTLQYCNFWSKLSWKHGYSLSLKENLRSGIQTRLTVAEKQEFSYSNI